MALPDNCRLEDDELVFYELAREATLADAEGLYGHVCFVACTNALRPAGVPTVIRFGFPTMTADDVVDWGSRYLTRALVDEYRRDGYVLCELRLPVTPMAAGR